MDHSNGNQVKDVDPEGYLHTIGVAIEMGCCANIRSMMGRWGGMLEVAEDPRHRADYELLLAKAQEMFEIEKVYGAGSLLELEHPIFVSLQARPVKTFPAVEIQAAMRYRAAKNVMAA